MIYFLRKPEVLHLKKYLPKERRKKADSLKREVDKNNCIGGFLLLMYALNKTKLPDFSYYENGKPYFKEYPDIHFNISHCKYGVALIVSEKPAGIDIHDIRTFNYNTAKRVCSDRELEFLLKSDNSDYEFSKLWSVKEAIVKQSGAGIAGGIKNASADCKLKIKTYCYSGFFISVCTED